ncbi:GtrA family protein [Filimonas effusa]|uniref:GtrA family protein n=1 Tax=Filimonas effusa TaxID=2508721 RepID=A0A4Q1D8K1_9BACT|nr:GtrA family protein [Filimonas effusa]RXK85611.1 GtrA family protein [Filimonas effusa]
MKKVHHLLKRSILQLIDSFYPWFRRLMPLETFRYAACGGGNTLLNLAIYVFSLHFIFDKQVFHVPFLPLAFEPHIAAYLLAFFVTFPSGFYLSMFVVFPESALRRRIQLFRYLLVVLACMVLNYGFLKLFVDYLGWYPTPSMVLTVAMVVSFSYLSQRHFSFQKKKEGFGKATTTEVD